MHVRETESGKWGKSAKTPSRSDGVKRSALSQLTGRRDKVEVQEEEVLSQVKNTSPAEGQAVKNGRREKKRETGMVGVKPPLIAQRQLICYKSLTLLPSTRKSAGTCVHMHFQVRVRTHLLMHSFFFFFQSLEL